MLGEKIVKDIVHGYIAIPKEYFKHIIDTEYFQRLRRIEQSSMRVVYPCGRHDRFIHSIGVYYLGKMAFKSFRKNCTEGRNGLKGVSEKELIYVADDNGFWKRSQFNFEVACLLHDVGHTPLSHTTEDFYKQKLFTVNEDGIQLKNVFSEEECKSDYFQNNCESIVALLTVLDKKPEIYFLLLREMLKHKFDMDSVQQIINGICDNESKTKTHEIMSSIVILEKFDIPIKNVANDFNLLEQEIDFDFIIRCIMGIPYIVTENEYTSLTAGSAARRQTKDIIISLLNGSCLDVDKLDYFQRDVMMSGFNTASIDMERLINAFTIEFQNGKLNLALQGQALSVVQSIIQINNDLYTWIYGHHKVVYEHRIIVDILSEALQGDGDWKEFFTYNTMIENLITDDDLWVKMKQEKDKIPQVRELLTREAQLKPIWKSTAEFHTRCKKLYGKITNEKNEKRIYVSYINDNCIHDNAIQLREKIAEKLDMAGDISGIMLEKGKTRDMRRKDWRVRIQINKKFNDFWEFMEPHQGKEDSGEEKTNPNTIYFYLYFSQEALGKLDRYKEINKGKDIADILIEIVNEMVTKDE